MLTNLDRHYLVLQECLHGLNEHLGDLSILFGMVVPVLNAWLKSKYQNGEEYTYAKAKLIGDRKSINKGQLDLFFLPSSLCCAPDLGSSGKTPQLTGLLLTIRDIRCPCGRINCLK